MNKEELTREMYVTADSFYQLRTKDGIEQWSSVFLSWRELVLKETAEHQVLHMQVLKNAMEALEQKEYILLADVLCFDAVQLLEE